MIHKITYEYKGIKVTVEADERAIGDDVEAAINHSKEKLVRLFTPLEGIKCNVSYRHEVPKVLGAKEIGQVLNVCEKSAYQLIQRAIKGSNMFKVIKVGNHYKIPRDSFLNWLESIDSV
jgi:hypothetical protein